MVVVKSSGAWDGELVFNGHEVSVLHNEESQRWKAVMSAHR